MWYAGHQAPRHKARYDAVIIGSGVGGSMAAHALVHAGLEVLMIERGPRVTRSPDNWSPESALDLSPYYSMDTHYKVRGDDRARVGDLLQAAGLPLRGFPADTPVVLVAQDEGRVVGGVALERWADALLLRSLVVDPSFRGRGLGLALTVAAMARGRASGAASISLLTETAEAFFIRMGFRRVAREDLPESLGRSEELRGACPESAAVLTLPLGEPDGG